MDTTEVRTTNEKTGGQKGAKLQRFASMPTKALLELAEHYGKGVTKYPDIGIGPNYSRGYDWHLSYEAAMRHLTQFWSGEDLDPETGSKHVIAAAWHCLALALFMDTHPELDDRWEKPHPGDVFNADYLRSREDDRWEKTPTEFGPINPSVVKERPFYSDSHLRHRED